MSSAEVAGGNSMNSQAQASLLAAMLEPEFYPKPPTAVTHKETHISHLFFAGALVYKVKKPVRYSFLDYSTLAKRRYFLQEELRLNRRLAPSVYIGVLPITFDDLGWRLGGWAEPAEYTLVMRRLADKRMLPFLLETGQVTAPMMRELAELLAKFHAEADRVAALDAQNYPAIVAKRWHDNRADIEPFLGKVVDPEDFRAVDKFGTDFIKSHGELFTRRAQQGWIRDVHGDLHAEHICFAPEGIQIFDCIDFEPRFRQCDLAAEIAFLAMDLEVRGGAGLVEIFLKRYGELLGDNEAGDLLPFWQCYRALVRAKVYLLRGPDGFAMAERYLRYAVRLSWRPLEPFLLMMSGLTGSGKSTLARALSERTGIATINSDTVRKELAGSSGRQTAPYNEGIYSVTMTEKTYAKMARMAGKLLTQGRAVIVDATFLRRAQREKFARLAEKHRIELVSIHCSAAAAITKNRLLQRASLATDVSDGHWEIYLKQKEIDEPIDEIAADNRLYLNTDASAEKLTGACEQFLRARFTRND
ncbi:MAG: aminoglycoside phosphotransferase [Deltaproteobacteria bacterium]|nr:aminoglycoside phosphotransferase [Deltaproteobacteria bacterium]